MTAASVIKFMMADLENLCEFWRPKISAMSFTLEDVEFHVAKLDSLLDFWLRLSILNGASADSEKCVRCDLRKSCPSSKSRRSCAEIGSQTEDDRLEIGSQTENDRLVDCPRNPEESQSDSSDIQMTESQDGGEEVTSDLIEAQTEVASDNDLEAITNQNDAENQEESQSGDFPHEEPVQDGSNATPPSLPDDNFVQTHSPIKLEEEVLPFEEPDGWRHSDDESHPQNVPIPNEPSSYISPSSEPLHLKSNNNGFITIHSDFVKEENDQEVPRPPRNTARDPAGPLRSKLNPIVVLDKRVADRVLRAHQMFLDSRNLSEKSQDFESTRLPTGGDWTNVRLLFHPH